MNSKTFGILLIFLAVFFNFYFRYPFLNIPLERDEGEYAYIADVIEDGGLPYRDAFDQKPPGIFYLYYLVFLIFGKKVIALRLFAAFYNLISVYFVYKIGKLLKGKDLGFVAALIFSLTSSERRLLGFSANTEVFMLAPIIAGTYFALAYLASKKMAALIISGALFGVSVMFKQPAFLNFFCMFFFIAYYGIKEKESVTRYLKACLAMAAAFAVPILLSALYFAGSGAFDDFKYQVLLHNVAYIGWAIPKGHGMKNLLDTLSFLSQSQAVLWALLFFGMIVIIFERRAKYFEFIIFWFLFSFLAVSLGKRFTLHYFEQLMPPLALISGMGLIGLTTFLNRNKVPKLGFSVFMVFLLVLLLPYKANRAYSDYSKQELTSAIYSGNPFNEDVKAAEFIKQNSDIKDKVFVAGSEPQILFYADRKSASRYIFFYPLTGGYADSLDKQKEVIGELNKELPRYIVYSNYLLSLGITPKCPRYIFEELDKILQNYTLIALVDPKQPSIVCSGKELERLFEEEKNMFYKERLFIYEKKISTTSLSRISYDTLSSSVSLRGAKRRGNLQNVEIASPLARNDKPHLTVVLGGTEKYIAPQDHSILLMVLSKVEALQ
ncbi:MAG: glycosyltransferase family 39 protein [Elusimicrobia bacterium]|nr:glycosyltransferase family 39 protein [Candidatus Liberimonas magnetica]